MLIGREEQIEALERIAALHTHVNASFVRVFEAPASVVLIYGSVSTGKSTCVAQLLHERAPVYAMIDCHAMFSTQDVYREILAHLYKNQHQHHFQHQTDDIITVIEDRNDAFEGYASLDFLSFLKALDVFMKATGASTMYVALDHVERLLERPKLRALLPCLVRLQETLGLHHIQWNLSLLLLTRAVSMELDRVIAPAFPIYLHFPLYSKDQVVRIVLKQLQLADDPLMRKWLVALWGLLPPAHNDWLDFRRSVVSILSKFPDFKALVAAQDEKKLWRRTTDRVLVLQRTRRRDLFGHDDVSTAFSTTDCVATLTRNCRLLILAGYLASFNPPDADRIFLSGTSGLKKTKRQKRPTEQISSVLHVNQLLIGPKIFKLQRLLAIYLSVQSENNQEEPTNDPDAREDVFTHLRTLVRMKIFQRTSPPEALEDIKFRCLADDRFVQATATSLSFPLETYRNTMP